MQAHEKIEISTTLHPPKVWIMTFGDDIYSILKYTHLENIFHQISNLHQNTEISMKK